MTPPGLFCLRVQLSVSILARIDAMSDRTHKDWREITFQKMLFAFGRKHGIDIPQITPPSKPKPPDRANTRRRYTSSHGINVWIPTERKNSWLTRLMEACGEPRINQLLKRVAAEITEKELL